MKPDYNTVKLNSMECDMTEIKTDIKYLKESHDELKKDLKYFLESADKKYASKLTEQIVYSLVGLILVSVVTAIIMLVL